MVKRMKTRLSCRSGFTLSETLMAILILLMVSSIVAAGIPVAANAYSKVVMASNAQLLLSTTMTNLRDELGTATDITVKKDDNNNVTIEYKNDKGGSSVISQVAQKDPENAVELGVYVYENSGTSQHKYLLVSDKAATENLYLTYTISGYNGGSFIKFDKLTVKTKDADKVISEIENFEIKVLTVR